MARGGWCKKLKRSSSPADEIIKLKLVVDDENKRVLYAEAGVEFVDFLFSIMSLPLAFFAGPGECRLVVGRLYESLTKMEDSFFEASRWGKEELLRPALPSTFAGVKPGWPCEVKARRPGGKRPAVKEKRGGGGMIYMITNELEVTPMSTASIIALMKSFEVSIGDVDERTVTVGPKETFLSVVAL
ncbi:hypothetical protein EJ110_NYTH52392 [Nymphaea thermarum]|nr:hypothetical protein EJ110_NYTH52392 [Nymphaea thermarum]